MASSIASMTMALSISFFARDCVGDGEQLGLVGGGSGGRAGSCSRGHGVQPSVLIKSAPSVLSGAVALMSLSVKSSLADAMFERDLGSPLGVATHDIVVDSFDDAGNLLGAVERLGKLEPRLMPRPVGKVPWAGQRPVDARR